MAKQQINILAVENDILAMLEDVSGIDRIFRETDSDDFDADSVDEPVLLVQNGGYKVKEADGAGCYQSQQFFSIWVVSVVCKKEDALSKGSLVMMDMINRLKNSKAAGWRRPLRITTDVKDFARPSMSERVMMYPVFFSLELVV